MELRRPQDWQRRGRGRERQFFATDEEVQRYLENLPAALGPYDLIVVQHFPAGKETSGPESFITTVSSHFANPRGHTLWLRAAALTPPIPLNSQVERWCAVNGLILIQHGA